MASLFPAELDLGAIIGQVEQLAQLLSEVAAERYRLTISVPADLLAHMFFCQLRTRPADHAGQSPPQGGDGQRDQHPGADDAPTVVCAGDDRLPDLRRPHYAAAVHHGGARVRLAQRPRHLQPLRNPGVAPGAGQWLPCSLLRHE